MKKNFLIIFIILIFSNYLNAENILSGRMYHQYMGAIEFKENKMTVFGPVFPGNDDVDSEKTYEYEIIYKNKIPFLKFDNSEWLILYSNEVLILYKEGDNKSFFFGALEKPVVNIYYSSSIYDTTSFLKEGNIEYTKENLANESLEKPWVEGVQGYGIGEKIKINYIKDDDPFYLSKKLLFSNGYVSYKNPCLYEANARVKKIRIFDKDNNKEMIIELEDTPNIQVIDFPEPFGKLEIEILEVYEGTKYKDTCVNFIFIYQGVN